MEKLQKSVALLLFVCALVSCQKAFVDDDAPSGNNVQRITFRLVTPSVTRATSVADFKKIVVVDVKDGSVEQVVSQSATDNTFGSPTPSLNPGTHTLTFLATDADNTSVEGTVVKQQPLGDTFVRSISIDTHKADEQQQVVLMRQVARVKYEGESSVIVRGVLSDMDLTTLTPGNSSSVTLEKGESVYTYVPASGTVSYDSKTVRVARNQTTIISDGEVSEPQQGDTDGEYLAIENDTAQIYVAKMEIKDVMLSKIADPMTRFAAEMQPYRMPTRQEAYFLQDVILPDGYWSGTRCLCYDRLEDAGFDGRSGWGSGYYYGFAFASEGTNSLQRAGNKINYSIKPVRVVPLAPVSLPFSLTADFSWSTDTIRGAK